MSGELVLISSYPKSGNTWARLILECLLRNEAVSINDIGIGHYGLKRRMIFDALAPAEAAELLPDEIDALMPHVLSNLADAAEGTIFIKVHDRLRRTGHGEWLFPPDRVKAVIYLVRHPFDVAVSYARHMAVEVGRAAEWLVDDAHLVAGGRAELPLPLTERTGSWSTHVSSWLEGAPYPVTCLRYEDMIRAPAAQCARMAEAAGIAVSEGSLARAVSATRFERLRHEERRHGFRERPQASTAFFREGKATSWHNQLDTASCKLLQDALGPTMTKLGYQPR
jgi:hypothetical protein